MGSRPMGWGVGLVVAVCLGGAAMGAGFGFRGDGSGVFAGAAPAAAWTGGSNVLWKTKMPSWSNSSPVPSGDRVFVCSEPFTLVCVAEKDGMILWQATNDYSVVLSEAAAARLAEERARMRQCDDLLRDAREAMNGLSRDVQEAANRQAVTGRVAQITARLAELAQKWQPTPVEREYRLPPTHGATGYSTATPVADAQHVWALFGNGVLACYARDGRRKWAQVVDRSRSGHGHSASPVLAGGKLVVAVNDLRAFDPETGEKLWTTPSGTRFGTPVVTAIGGVAVVVTANGEVVRASDGRVVASGMGGLAFNSPIVSGNTIIGFNEGEARAYELPGATTNAAPAKLLWKAPVARDRHYASPVAHGEHVYGIGAGGLLSILNLRTGANVAEKKLAMGGTCYSSLTVAGGRVYASSEKGITIALKADGTGDEVSTTRFEEMRSSLACRGERIYLRTMGSLCCIGAK